MSALEAAPAFGPATPARPTTGRQFGRGGVGAEYLGDRIVRALTSPFLRALTEAVARHADAERKHQGLPIDDGDAVEDLAEVTARRFANTAVSHYERDASSDWPLLASSDPGLVASMHLAPSGLVRYSLGPREDPTSSAPRWQLSGEGCWRVLTDPSRPTLVLLEMWQGLMGTCPPQEASGGSSTRHRVPFQLSVDLVECERVIAPGAGEDDSDEDEEEDEDDED